ncbi:MAG: YqgE/AlgH family protein [Dehalococcoidia bacterium]
MAENATGRLLVATPSLTDANFQRTVILLALHDEAGAFGVVLNRPSVAEVREYLPDWTAVVPPPGFIFRGGPVEPTSVIALGRRDDGGEDGWKRVLGDLGIVDLKDPEQARTREWSAVRFYSGYAGWGGGQLDGELEAGAWWVAAPRRRDIFTETPEDLWREVVQRSPETQMYAHFPSDPRAN